MIIFDQLLMTYQSYKRVFIPVMVYNCLYRIVCNIIVGDMMNCDLHRLLHIRAQTNSIEFYHIAGVYLL